MGLRILVLTTDAYGGHGGIALYNRDIADALAAMPEVSEVIVIPRTLPFAPTGIPAKVRFVAGAAGSKTRYLAASLVAAARGQFDLIVCGHINLLPLAAVLKLKLRAPLALMVYGIDVWAKPSWLAGRWLAAVNAVWSISAVTRDRMNQWAGLAQQRYTLLPNAIHLDRYGTATRRADLMARHGLTAGCVIMTLARLPSMERYKGVDEVMEVLPTLLRDRPNLKYLVAGDGDDQPRLMQKAKALGLAEQVVFVGMVAETDKADYFRLADAFVMPGRGEGFGFVFLEALACGVPAVGSLVDGSREALREGELGELADPTNPASIVACIQRALARGPGIPQGLSYFAWPRFQERLANAVGQLMYRSVGSFH